MCFVPRLKKRVRNGVTYRVETTWDDGTGNAEVREFDQQGTLVRRCEWSIWPDHERRDDLIGKQSGSTHVTSRSSTSLSVSVPRKKRARVTFPSLAQTGGQERSSR